MFGTVKNESASEEMRLFVSLKQLKVSDWQIITDYVMADESNTASSAIQTGEFTQPLSMVSKVCLVVGIVLYRVISIVYHVFYFYFAPFIIAIVVIYSGAIKNMREKETDAAAVESASP